MSRMRATTRAHAVLERRILAARERTFVGRTHELALFEKTLTGAPDTHPVLWFHGPGGIGKSALLDRFARTARAAGRFVVAVDGRSVETTAEAFASAAEPVLREPGAVLLVDAFERCRGLETWLMEDFLPRIPLGAAVVIAGRDAPDPRWTADPGWADVLRSVALREFDAVDAARYLQLRGLPGAAQASLLPIVGGNPLALSLAAEAMIAAGRPALTEHSKAARKLAEWRLGQEVLGSLLPHLLGRLPSPEHRRALEICAHLRVTTEALLRDVLGERAPELFDWLRAQPFVSGAEDGLYPHDAVCGALRADLRWRDPEGARQLHGQLHGALLDRVRSVADAEVPRAVHDLMYLHMPPGHQCGYRGAVGVGVGVRDVPYAPADRPQVLALARQVEGDESAELVAHWLDRQPEAFRVHRVAWRDENEIAAFSAFLRVPVGASEAADSDADPVVSAARAHARTTAPALTGDQLGVARFLFVPPGPRADDSQRVMWWRVAGQVLRTDELAWVFTAARAGHGWTLPERYLTPLDQRPVAAGHTYTLHALDLRAHPLAPLLETTLRARLSGEPRPERATRRAGRTAAPVLHRADFDAAVRDALRALRTPDLLAVNPLTRCRIADVPGTDLAGVLARAIAALPRERRGTKWHRALVTTYVKGSPTQQAAAHRLGLPFSTYRRHLTGGVQRVCDLLWQWELKGVPPEGQGAAGG